MRTIYVACLAHRHTGGLTLAHQLCFKLIKLGFNAKMFYYFTKKGQDPVNENYKKYNLPIAKEIIDSEENILVVPETNVNLLRKVKKIKKVIWWMSVDNYFKSLKSKRNTLIDFFGLNRYNFRKDGVLHLVQSYYAKDFLSKEGVSDSRIYYLSDYLDTNFIKNATKGTGKDRQPIVLYNPRKGYEFTSLLINAAPEINWFPLENLSPEQMADIMLKSMVYIDFGNHPGKDRIPREAAISGCCVITGIRGSAGFFEDVPISEEYKFEDASVMVPNIIKKIKSIFNQFQESSAQFEEYRSYILREEDQFEKDIINIFSKI